MSGLEIRAENGAILFSNTTRNFSIIGVVSDTGNVNGSAYMPFSQWAGVPQTIVMPLSPTYYGSPPVVTISGDGVYWNFTGANYWDKIPCRIICGVW